MSTREIPASPASKEITCDCCKKICGIEVRYLQEGRLLIRRHALDWNDRPCADGSLSLDLCDDCLAKVCKAVNDAVE